MNLQPARRRSGGELNGSVLALFLAALASAALGGCSLDRGAIPEGDGGGGRDGAADTATGCSPGFADLDGRPGCECVIEVEVCNAADDDCNRRIDEDSDVACGTPGTCSAGARACVAGSFGPCMPTMAPPPESCGNAIDDDCDMAVDEECACTPTGATQACGDGTGECMEGRQTCAADGWGPCEGAVGPATETCNNLDDDCDGTIDGMTRPCSADVGICMAGVETCRAGRYRACSGVLARTETCDAPRLDEDCDGVANEGCPCDEGDTRACGSCIGTQTCDLSGSWGACMDMPGTRSCNGIDDDCDGTTDEGTTCGACTQENDGDRSYLFCFTITRTWAAARAYCMMYGYDLVSVETEAENDWLNGRERALHVNNVFWWYGGTDAAVEGTWRWEPTMATFGYDDWEDSEPVGGTTNNCLYNENRSNPEWHTDECAVEHIFVCEDQDS